MQLCGPNLSIEDKPAHPNFATLESRCTRVSLSLFSTRRDESIYFVNSSDRKIHGSRQLVNLEFGETLQQRWFDRCLETSLLAEKLPPKLSVYSFECATGVLRCEPEFNFLQIRVELWNIEGRKERLDENANG